MTDGRGTVSNYTYDNGGRLTARNFPANPAEDQTFTYQHLGSASPGELAQITDESGSIQRSYADGYVDQEQRTIDSASYAIGYDFGNYGVLEQVTTPGQLAIQYTRDNQDRISDITV